MTDLSNEARIYLIRKQGLWYRPDERGYTTSAIQAGRYTEDEALRITHPNGPTGPRDGMCYCHENEVKDDDWRAFSALLAERDDAIRAKDCFQRMTLAHWEALCAMRNSINEYIPMPNTDSGPLFSPDDGPIYADIAERVIADLAESRAYALALEQELRDRAEKAETERDAAMEVAVKVKPLVWFEVEKSRYGGKYTADGYTIRYIEGLWLLDFAGQSKAIWRFPTIEAAKSAAQADYEARILAAIQPDPEAHQAAPSDHLTRYIRHDAPELLEMLEAATDHAFENDYCRSSLYAAIEGLQRLVTGKGEL